MRTSPVHYIAPSAISIIPNANGLQRDIAVYIAQGTKIKVHCPRAGIGTDGDGNYQEWILGGRNRRLADTIGRQEYTIYARLSKSDYSTGYLVFAPKTDIGNDKYQYLTLDGSAIRGITSVAGAITSNSEWYVRLGDVSAVENGERTVMLDTGILGTDQYNNDWAQNPDDLPLRIELGCTVNDEDVGLNPYVYWDQQLVLTATLTEGWADTKIQRFDHWEITRKTDNDPREDRHWLDGDEREAAFSTSGEITLKHLRGDDDFNGAVATTFTIMAMERDPEDDSQWLVLKSATITILAETIEKYELALSSAIVSYSPQTGDCSPADGVSVRIRATDQRGNIFELTNKQYTEAGLRTFYAPIDSRFPSIPNLVFSGGINAVAVATIPTAGQNNAFAAQQSLNVRLTKSDGTELALDTIAFVRDGEDSKEREWIYTRRTSATTFSGSTGANALPSLITLGEVRPAGIASGTTVYDEGLDEWVPNGWTDDPQGTNQNNPYEYASHRDYIQGSGWGPFSEPKVWGHYGKDGTQTQRRYRSTNSPVYTDTAPTTEDVPAGWGAVGQPTQISTTARYRWMIERYSTDGGATWIYWSTPVIDAYMAEDGTSVSINGEAQGHYANFSALNAARQNGTITPDMDDLFLLDTSSDYSEEDEVTGDSIEGFAAPTIMRFVSSPSGNDWEPAQADIGDGYLIGGNLWMAQQSEWKDLGNIKGPKGDDGEDAVTYDIEFTEAWAKATPEGVISARLRGYAYRIQGSARTPMTKATIRYGYDTQDSNTYASTITNGYGYFTEYEWFDGDELDDYAQGSAVVFASIIVSGAAVCTKHVTIVQEAANGTPGHTGRFYYYAGEWNANGIYRIEQTQAPYVKYSKEINGATQTGFFMLDNGGKEPSYNNWPSDGHPAEPSFTTGVNTPWTQMASEHQYYIARAFFGENAYLGSFIINGDWMISQYGTIYDSSGTAHEIDGTSSYGGYTKDNAYTLFNPQYPASSQPGANNFCPNFAVDGKTGNTIQGKGIFRGEVHATSGEFNGTVKANLFYARTKWFDMPANDYQTYYIDPVSEPYSNFGVAPAQAFHGVVTIYLPIAADYDGIEFTFFSAPFEQYQTGVMDILPKSDDNLYVYSESSKKYVAASAIVPMKGIAKVKSFNGKWFLIEGDPSEAVLKTS